MRDKALLWLATDSWCRASELVAFKVRDVTRQEDGSSVLFVARSRTDPFGEGAYAFLSARGTVDVLRWIEVAVLRQDDPILTKSQKGSMKTPLDPAKASRVKSVARAGQTFQRTARASVGFRMPSGLVATCPRSWSPDAGGHQRCRHFMDDRSSPASRRRRRYRRRLTMRATLGELGELPRSRLHEVQARKHEIARTSYDRIFLALRNSSAINKV
ncbi:hypothetical protein SAMN04490244_10395 [Tranquillimonas rosea]|uniref:Phage integrase family protein n=1 Tax=Tranquillimonas rosea TaxID=641238 RepID=A0A1H9S9G9_9RHOB|nr:hypothetical protein SAMN04490244_10395 [Tranquillimonas rosea]